MIHWELVDWKLKDGRLCREQKLRRKFARSTTDWLENEKKEDSRLELDRKETSVLTSTRRTFSIDMKIIMRRGSVSDFEFYTVYKSYKINKKMYNILILNTKTLNIKKRKNVNQSVKKQTNYCIFSKSKTFRIEKKAA